MKILYGVAGEGSGHAIRSKPILEHLSKKHDILVVGGGRAYSILSKYFRAEEIYAHKIIIEENSAKNKHTILHAIKNLPNIMKSNIKMIKTILKFKPDLMITDFEPFTSYASLLFRTPCISIDNMHIITNSKLEVKESLIDEIISKIVIKFWIPKADSFIITTFFYPKINKKNTFLFSPINREEIQKAVSKKGRHILIY